MTKLTKKVTAFSFKSEGLPFDVDEKPTSVKSVHTSVHTDRQRDKLSGPSSIAGGPQKN